MLHQSRQFLQQGVYKLYKFKSVYKHAQVVEQTIFDCSDVSLPWLEKTRRGTWREVRKTSETQNNTTPTNCNSQQKQCFHKV